MEPRPFTLRLFVPSGRPEEIRILEKIGWSGIGLSVPRSHLLEFKNRKESSGPGIYVLHGPEPEGIQDSVYIGEADPLDRRLRQHHRDKDFWTIAYVFTVQNDHLNKAHFQYLEAQLLQYARDARRCQLKNGDSGNSITLSEPDKASAETFLEELLLCCPIFGLRAFEKPERPMQQTDGNTRLQESSNQSSEPNSSEIFYYLKSREAQGKGYESPNGFTVLKGAKGRKEPVGSFPEGCSRIRDELLQRGVFTMAEDIIYMKQDYEFSSPSAAASILLGNSSNGTSAWKDRTGKTLKQRREMMSDEVSGEESSSQEITNETNEPELTGTTEQPDQSGDQQEEARDA